MTPFSVRRVGGADTLGERLRRLREAAGLSLEELAARAQVPARHLRAIEEGQYAVLPGLVYGRHFVRRLAVTLEVREATVLDRFEREYRLATRTASPKPTAPPSRPVRMGSLVTPRRLRVAFLVALGLAVLVYLATELQRLAAPPTLVVLSPTVDQTTRERSVELSGRTNPETTVTANGRVILVDRSGAFSELLDLQPGLNTIVIRAQRKRGGTTTVIRRILVQSSDSSP